MFNDNERGGLKVFSLAFYVFLIVKWKIMCNFVRKISVYAVFGNVFIL